MTNGCCFLLPFSNSMYHHVVKYFWQKVRLCYTHLHLWLLLVSSMLVAVVSPVALDGCVGLDTAESVAADDDRLRGSRNAERRLLLGAAAVSSTSDTLCRWPRDDIADDDDGSGSTTGWELVLCRGRPLLTWLVPPAPADSQWASTFNWKALTPCHTNHIHYTFSWL